MAGARTHPARPANERYPGYRVAANAPGSAMGAAVVDTVPGYVARVLAERHEPFDWNRADDAALCDALGGGAGPLVVGAHASEGASPSVTVDVLVSEIRRALGHAVRVVGRNDRLATIRLDVDACADVATLRALPVVAFVEVAYAPVLATPATASTASASAEAIGAVPRAAGTFNPGLYDPAASTGASYVDYMERVDPDAAARIRRQHADTVYDELGYFGGPDVGVAVLDNGVLADWIPFLSTGRGTYRTAGYHPPDLGEIHPQEDDFFGLSLLIPTAFDHGTRQSRHVQSFSPQSNRATVRSSSLPFVFLPNDFTGITNAILAMADDDGVQVVSMSMGTIVRSHEMERAIDALYTRGKILIAAAGTTLPVIKDLIGVVFPATLPTVISATGLADTDETGGAFELGFNSHGGPENDFVIEPSPASSEAVSSLAGLITTLWSIDPRQPRESILDALIRSSNFYRERGTKNPLFGWGRVDAYDAALTIRRGGCVVANR